jgi:23S rRNA pseudouridine1911/1915/1917 synthase
MRIGKKFSKPTMSRLKNGDIIPSNTPIEEQRNRLDHTLITIHPEYPRNVLQSFIKSGSVTVNKKVVKKPNHKVCETDQILLTVPERQQKPSIPIIYEDDNVVVLDKPAGLLSMSKGAFNPEPTLEDYGLLVHRLDRDTSGVVILAKNELAQTLLRKQFQNRKARKTYYAITVGHPKLNQAIINVPLARNLKAPTTFVPDPQGREAITEYKVTQQADKYSLLELHPTTGRTHQLRVHLKHIGTPILGDSVYGHSHPDRLYLHAHQLEITIPGTPNNIRKTFTSPLPQDFKNVLK